MRSWLGVGLVLFSLAAQGQASPLRAQYQAADQALKKNDQLKYSQLRAGLDSYPLTIYLDYQELDNNLSRVTTQQVTQFINRYPDSMLGDRLEGRYLRRLAAEQRWQEFLRLYPELPNSVDLQCAHYRAQWANGDKKIAMAGAEKMWLYGGSRPNSCDPLFSTWASIGGRSDEHIWERMLLAYEKGQDGLVTYLNRQLSSSAQPAGDLLERLSKQPQLLLGANPIKAHTRREQAAVAVALERLANTEPDAVMRLYPQYARSAELRPEQVAKIEQQLARRLMFNRTYDYRSWLDKRLPEVGDQDLFELRARLAIWEQDWSSLPRWIALLPKSEQQDSLWLYWQGRALNAQNRQAEGNKAWQDAAKQRNYYGFLAAQQSKNAFALYKEAAPNTLTLAQARNRWPAVARVEEWLALGNKTAARSEWYHLLSKVDPNDAIALGSMALNQGWHDKSILATIQAKAWDHLDLRFPVVYRDAFQQQARRLAVDEAILFAIARQESAFYEQARSPVGAGGLMQLMPATAKATARKYNINDYQREPDVYRPEVNVQLGSHYFKEMLGRYNNNRIAAIAAYNAGPSRIDRWLRDSASRPLDVWVENIPYRETRGYVQNVLVYSVIYQDKLGQSPHFIKPAELNYVY